MCVVCWCSNLNLPTRFWYVAWTGFYTAICAVQLQHTTHYSSFSQGLYLHQGEPRYSNMCCLLQAHVQSRVRWSTYFLLRALTVKPTKEYMNEAPLNSITSDNRDASASAGLKVYV